MQPRPRGVPMPAGTPVQPAHLRHLVHSRREHADRRVAAAGTACSAHACQHMQRCPVGLPMPAAMPAQPGHLRHLRSSLAICGTSGPAWPSEAPPVQPAGVRTAHFARAASGVSGMQGRRRWCRLRRSRSPAHAATADRRAHLRRLRHGMGGVGARGWDMHAPIVGRGCGFLLKEGRRRRSDGKAWSGRRAAAWQQRAGYGVR